MAITNFVITTNGAGYAESDGLNPIASTEATAVIKNGIVSIVLSDGSSWKNTPLENCTLDGTPLDANPRIAIDQLALAGFRTPSGGSGGGAVDSWNGQTGNVVYDVLRKTNGVTPADSYNEDLHHNGWYKTVDNTNKVLAGLAKLDTGEFGASNPHGQLELYKRDGKPFGGLGLDLGATIWGYGNNDGAQNLSLVASTLAGGALPSATEIIGLWNYTNKLVTLLGSGQLKLENYTGANFDGEGQFLTVDSTGLVKKSVGSTLTVISWLTRHRGTLASPITISSTPVDLTSVLGNLTLTSENGIITYDAVNNVFKADANTTSYYAFDVVIRLTGTVQGGGTSSFIFELRRPDNVTIITSDYSRIGGTGNLLNTQVSAIDTRVFSGGTDNYQTQGFRIFGRKVDGNNLILSNGVDDFQELILER